MSKAGVCFYEVVSGVTLVRKETLFCTEGVLGQRSPLLMGQEGSGPAQY